MISLTEQGVAGICGVAPGAQFSQLQATAFSLAVYEKFDKRPAFFSTCRDHKLLTSLQLNVSRSRHYLTFDALAKLKRAFCQAAFYNSSHQ